MISLEQATKKARNYVEEMVGFKYSKDDRHHLRLREASWDDDHNQWCVVFEYQEDVSYSKYTPEYSYPKERYYVQVDGEAEVVGFKRERVSDEEE